MQIFSFPPISDARAKVLILGSMPGIKSLSENQYYAHSGNQFWRIMFDLFDRIYSTEYAVRSKLIIDSKIALWDVLQACVRKTSSDNDILQEMPNDFKDFFNNHSKIKAIFFNGKNAEEYFRNYVHNVNLPSFILPSTSSANTWKSYNEKLNEWRIILRWL